MGQTAIVCGSLYYDTNLFPDYCLQALNISAAVSLLSRLGAGLMLGLTSVSLWIL